MDAAAMMEVVKNKVPNSPGSRPNLVWKKFVTQELWTVSNGVSRKVRKAEFLQIH